MNIAIDWLDVLIVLVLNGGMFVGFWQGALRQVMAFAAVYASIVISTRLYPTLSQTLLQVAPRMVGTVADVVTFMILLFVIGFVLTFLLLDVLRGYTNRPVSGLSRLSGAAIGLVIAAILVTVSLVALSFMTITTWPASSEPARQILQSGLAQSNLIVSFRLIVPWLLQAIRAWGGTLPPIFSVDIGPH
jgi:uncharacterized membrane protein required for colicin V production